MGRDAVEPFLSFKDKYAILLTLTSNEGASDFQFTKEKDQFLYQKILKTSLKWNNSERLMYVVGATKSEALKSIREIIPNSFLLVPGIGSQGGSLAEVVDSGMNDSCGLLVNSSRGILYKSQGLDFANAASEEAESLQKQMEFHLNKKGII